MESRFVVRIVITYALCTLFIYEVPSFGILSLELWNFVFVYFNIDMRVLLHVQQRNKTVQLCTETLCARGIFHELAVGLGQRRCLRATRAA